MSLGVVILAAGQGSRMRSQLPKVLHQLAGQPILQHVLNTAFSLEPATVAVVYGHGGELLLERFATAPVQWVRQAQQLGTAHAVTQALPVLHDVDQVLVLYGDVPLVSNVTLKNLIQICGNNPLGIITALVSNPTGYGRIVRDSAGHILRIVEQKDAADTLLAINEINTGIVIATSSHLTTWLKRIKNDNAQNEFYLTDIVELAVKDGYTVASVHPQHQDEILGINDRIQLSALERKLQCMQAEALMRNGVMLADPTRFDVRGSLETGIDVTIDINVIIEGQVILGDRVNIGPNCILRNCKIGNDTTIFANSMIEQSVINTNARIGPFARIRPGCEIHDGVHIGNFVELKNAKLGIKSKANHLSYLGDCDVGNHVNIGAGTITCNYDGMNKHKTVIGDNAFIGSNTALIAPIQIGNGATIGAGSVINNNAPADALTLTRPPQQTVVGWQRKDVKH